MPGRLSGRCKVHVPVKWIGRPEIGDLYGYQADRSRFVYNPNDLSGFNILAASTVKIMQDNCKPPC